MLRVGEIWCSAVGGEEQRRWLAVLKTCSAMVMISSECGIHCWRRCRAVVVFTAVGVFSFGDYA